MENCICNKSLCCKQTVFYWQNGVTRCAGKASLKGLVICVARLEFATAVNIMVGSSNFRAVLCLLTGKLLRKSVCGETIKMNFLFE